MSRFYDRGFQQPADASGRPKSPPTKREPRATPHKRGCRPTNGFFVRCRFRRFTGGKSRNLHAADGGKGIARRAVELCGNALAEPSSACRQTRDSLRNVRARRRNRNGNRRDGLPMPPVFQHRGAFRYSAGLSKGTYSRASTARPFASVAKTATPQPVSPGRYS